MVHFCHYILILKLYQNTKKVINTANKIQVFYNVKNQKLCYNYLHIIILGYEGDFNEYNYKSEK